MIGDVLLILLFLLIVTVSAILLGKYMSKVFTGKKTFMTPLLRPVEKFIYCICSIDENQEMTWKRYAYTLLIFNTLGILFLFVLQLIQNYLPLNPAGMTGVRWDTALNTAISFTTNTNWQSYAGEITMSYLTQMLGMTLQNFLSPAVGMATLLALIRGFTRKNSDTIGNFWVDLTRSILYVLLPLSVVFALILASQGVIQTLDGPLTVQTLDGANQTIALGPVASQLAIKMLGSNGGGFFNANSAHPFENPNGLTNILQTLAILLIPMALVFAFGYIIRNFRQGFAIYSAMMILLVAGIGVAYWAEIQPNPIIKELGVSGGNLEGKELSFGVGGSVLWGVLTTAVSNGAVNSMHGSTMPLTGMIYLFNMGIGEVIFGGLGVGLIGMLFYVILTMFIAGLMIGRTPEFLGKKLGPYEMIMAVIALVVPAASILVLSGIAISLPAGVTGLLNPLSRGLSEILYAYSSAVANNGSAFAGLTANTVFYNLTLGLGMLIGRFAVILPALAIAGALAKKGKVPVTFAAFPSTNALFVILLVTVVIIVGALTFFPVFSLGPILEHLHMNGGLTF
ncbi:MAG: potassium-transporting ATPase subunit KdpA [Methanobacterium sp.]|jgi:K+-transporting ATPase ATPase A chain